MSDDHADLMFRPALELAAMVRAGEVSSRELVEASLARIEALDPELNAFVDVVGDEALAAADAVGPGDQRPFAGVPIAIKNNVSLAGARLTYCAEFMGDFRAEHDSGVVARLKGAGFIPVGTTKLPEWGVLPWTHTRRFGKTRNPWDRERTSGGSSGGSATAVSSGMVPIAHANDGGGSTRIPAACCGLVGLKAARNRVSFSPEAGDSDLAIDGVLTRTVADTAAVLDVIAGYELGDANWAPPPARAFATAATEVPPAGLRIALALNTPLGSDVDPVAAQAARDAGALLESLGHHVEEVVAPWTGPELLQRFTAMFGPLVCLQIVHATMVSGRDPVQGDMEPVSWALYEQAKASSALDAVTAKAMLQIFARSLIVWASGYDAILTPSLAEAPVLLDEVAPDTDDPMGRFARSGRFTPFTAVANITGQPAISLPLYQRDDGLPLGVHLIGRPAGEAELLALATQIEATTSWAQRRPAE